jgi:hypothetical protein
VIPPRISAERLDPNRLTTVQSVLLLTSVTVLCLIPFANKAFHIDDPLFLWAAKQIQEHPLDFYGFKVNWYGTDMAMSTVMKNPPAASYYIALVASIVGWGEPPLHLFLFIPAVAVAVGTYVLARRFCAQPIVATLGGIFTPVFLLSATTVMSDLMMLAFWVWAVVLWVRGMDRGELALLVLSGVFIAICALTKYFGMSLIPLLFAYSLMKTRRPGWWMLGLAVPVILLSGYQWATEVLYGRGLLLDAAGYATSWSSGRGDLFAKGVTGLAFAGGCLLTVLFYSSLLWSRRALAGGTALAILIMLIMARVGTIGRFPLYDQGGIRWELVGHIALFVLAGISLLALAVCDFLQRKDADSLLLLLWVGGTFAFASFLNWTVNGRSLLPIAPAAGLLVMRRLEQRAEYRGSVGYWRVSWPLVLGLVAAMLVTSADKGLANSARDAAEAVHEQYATESGTLWFLGHWGFQYYMESKGGQPIDVIRSRIAPGDIVVVPQNNTNLFPLPQDKVLLVDEFEFFPSRWVGTMSSGLGSGFYADLWGPLPWVIGTVPGERYRVFSVLAPFQVRTKPRGR